MTLKGRDTLEGDSLGTLNENEEYREQTDKLFIPHSACGFHALSLGTDAKGKRGVPPPLLAAGVSRRERTTASEGSRPKIIDHPYRQPLPPTSAPPIGRSRTSAAVADLIGVQAAAKFQKTCNEPHGGAETVHCRGLSSSIRVIKTWVGSMRWRKMRLAYSASEAPHMLVASSCRDACLCCFPESLRALATRAACARSHRRLIGRETPMELGIMRTCGRCGKERILGEHDPCIPNLPDVQYACCGHGRGGATSC